MGEQHMCPRRGEVPVRGLPDHDGWRADDSCSFCGSLNPATFMARLELGDVELTPTDKNYKVYVRNTGDVAFRQAYRDCPPKADCAGPDDCAHWTTRSRDETKFYFQHLDAAQRTRFLELLNAGKLRLGYPGHFYRLPFFVRVNAA